MDSIGEVYYNDAQEGGDVDPGYRRYVADLHFVSSTAEGQRVLMYILDALGTFDPAWSPKNANMAKAIVLKDFGNEILDDIAVAAPEAHDNIQRSMRLARKSGLVNQVFNNRGE